MQLELSNLQPLAANEVIEEEVHDLAGGEQLSERRSKTKIRGLLRSYAQSD
jgi:hypothetical protein